MTKPTKEKHYKIQWKEKYPLLDSKTQRVVGGIEGALFSIEIPYRLIHGEAVPQGVGMREAFAEHYKPMDQELGREWIEDRLRGEVDYFHLYFETLDLGKEPDYLLKASGRVYYSTIPIYEQRSFFAGWNQPEEK